MTFYTDDYTGEEEDLKFTRQEKLTMLGILGGIILTVILMYFVSTHRDKGTIMFGVCRTFVEMQLVYPPKLAVTEVEQYPMAVRIYYNYTDPYGNLKSEFVECGFEMVPGKGAQATSILLNRKEIDHEVIAYFNETIPSIVAGDPDLYLPDRLPDDIESLKR